MHSFSARNRSEAVVPADRDEIWDVLTSPTLLAELTPLLSAITVDGDHWCWQLSGISALGVHVAPSFTELMTFTAPSEIRFTHDPPPGTHERAGAEGVYRLDARGEATALSIDIALHVELPLPRASRIAVERIMATAIDKTGDAFAHRLYVHLGIDPATVVKTSRTT